MQKDRELMLSAVGLAWSLLNQCEEKMSLPQMTLETRVSRAQFSATPLPTPPPPRALAFQLPHEKLLILYCRKKQHVTFLGIFPCGVNEDINVCI